MPQEDTRWWLHQRSLEAWATEDLEPGDIAWIMEVENNQTTLLRWETDPRALLHPVWRGGDQTPASGGRWFINNGNMLMLAELTWWARCSLTLFDVYRMWLSLPVLAYTRKHSESQSEQAQFVRNAKMLKKQEHGRYGLNDPGREGRPRRR